MILYPYNPASKSSMCLAKSLNIKQIKHKNSSFKGAPHKIVLNWGASSYSDEISKCFVINNKEAVRIATNKLSTLQRLDGIVPIPPFTTDKEKACEWLGKGKIVFARYELSSCSGDGIKVLISKEELKEDAPLYTMYIPKVDEFRVHVHKGSVFFVQRKAMRDGADNVNWKIRSHVNGFIFQHKDVAPILEAELMAVQAVNALGLHFGAVDIIYNKYQNKYYVLEVNTAPGLEGTTLQKYTEEFETYKGV